MLIFQTEVSSKPGGKIFIFLERSARKITKKSLIRCTLLVYHNLYCSVAIYAVLMHSMLFYCNLCCCIAIHAVLLPFCCNLRCFVATTWLVQNTRFHRHFWGGSQALSTFIDVWATHSILISFDLNLHFRLHLAYAVSLVMILIKQWQHLPSCSQVPNISRPYSSIVLGGTAGLRVLRLATPQLATQVCWRFNTATLPKKTVSYILLNLIFLATQLVNI